MPVTEQLVEVIVKAHHPISTDASRLFETKDVAQILTGFEVPSRLSHIVSRPLHLLLESAVPIYCTSTWWRDLTRSQRPFYLTYQIQGIGRLVSFWYPSYSSPRDFANSFSSTRACTTAHSGAMPEKRSPLAQIQDCYYAARLVTGYLELANCVSFDTIHL